MFPDWSGGVHSWSPGAAPARGTPWLPRRGSRTLRVYGAKAPTTHAARQQVTFLALPRKVTKRRRPRCAAAGAGPCSSAASRGLRNSPWRGIHPMPRCGARTVLAQTSARLHPICGTAHRGKGRSVVTCGRILLASQTPVRHRVAQAGQGKSDAYVRARDGYAGRASLRGGLDGRADEGSQRLAHRGVLSLLTFFAQAKKVTCCRQPRRQPQDTAEPIRKHLTPYHTRK